MLYCNVRNISDITEISGNQPWFLSMQGSCFHPSYGNQNDWWKKFFTSCADMNSIPCSIVSQQVSFNPSTVGIIYHFEFWFTMPFRSPTKLLSNQDFHEFWRRRSLGRGIPGSRRTSRTSRMRLSHVAKKGGRCCELVCLRSLQQVFWVVVSNIFYFHPYLGKISNLTNIFQRGWNHKLVLQVMNPQLKVTEIEHHKLSKMFGCCPTQDSRYSSHQEDDMKQFWSVSFDRKWVNWFFL